MATVKKAPVKKDRPEKPVLKKHDNEKSTARKKTSKKNDKDCLHDWEGFFQGNYAGQQLQSFICKKCGNKTDIDPDIITKKS